MRALILMSDSRIEGVSIVEDNFGARALKEKADNAGLILRDFVIDSLSDLEAFIDAEQREIDESCED